MSAKRRAGRKRKYALELDCLPKLPRLEFGETESSSLLTESSSLLAGSDSAEIGPSVVQTDIPQLEKLTWKGVTILGQALNLVPSAFRSYRLKYVASILNTGLNAEYSETDIAGFARAMTVEDQNLLGLPTEELLWKATMSSGRPCTGFLAPPTLQCLQCDGSLYTHNDPSVVVCFGQRGPFLASKITLRCKACHINYRYDQFGDEIEGYRYYDQQRPFVKASRTTFVSRDLYQFFAAAGHHAWCSFEAAAEIYNEAQRECGSFNASNTAAFVKKYPLRAQEITIETDSIGVFELHRKTVAEAFWTAEVESELRERADVGHTFTSAASREQFMDVADKQRALQPYPHDICSDECRKRGCGTLWSVDGLWKLVYPVCMYRVPKEVTGFSGQLKYVDACPGQPMHGKAFCEKHCRVAAEKEIPSGLRDFLRYCGVNKEDAATVNENQATEGHVGGSCLQSAADCQGK